MDVSLILCTCNRAESLRETFTSLEQLRLPASFAWELILVDNNSKDHTKKVVDEFKTRNVLPLKYVFEGQQGKSFALNRGIDRAQGEILAFTDDDVTVDPQWLAALTNTFDQFECLGVGGKIVDVWPIAKPDWLQEDHRVRFMDVIVRFDAGEQARALSRPPYGANMAIKKSAFERYGLFRTDMGPTQGRLQRGEDSEFCKRLLGAGENLVYAPSAVVYHPVARERIRKQYFQSWYFSYGRNAIRKSGIPPERASTCSLLVSLFRNLFGCLARWLINFRPARRFYYKLNFYLAMGKIVEAHLLLARSLQAGNSDTAD